MKGKPDEDIRFVGAFSKRGHDEVYSIDLDEMDRDQEFNGDHSFFKKYPEALIKSLPKKIDNE